MTRRFRVALGSFRFTEAVEAATPHEAALKVARAVFGYADPERVFVTPTLKFNFIVSIRDAHGNLLAQQTKILAWELRSA